MMIFVSGRRALMARAASRPLMLPGIRTSMSTRSAGLTRHHSRASAAVGKAAARR